MAKVKTSFFCQNCGASYPKWVGQCTSCKEWNTVVEEVVQRPDKKGWSSAPTARGTAKDASIPRRIQEVENQQYQRIAMPDEELNRVLGGGLVPGSLVLIGGEPGVGKSTLLLQMALQLPLKTLYISGEESAQQIKMRADRMGITAEDCYLLAETRTQSIFTHAEKLQPDLVIIDSIQTIHTDYIDSAAGSISQIRESTAELIKYAKETATPVLLVGHITKEGSIAGPKLLEHMVDAVLQFEGDRHYIYRILRSLKNRFGSTSELGIYEMRSNGMLPVKNPSELLLSSNSQSLSGSAVAATVEGMRPLLVEVQALVSTAVYGTPQRSATGFNAKRLNMLLAILEKKAGFKLGAKDVFLNLTGGIRIEDPALDLAVVAAILSSNVDTPLAKNQCFAAEIGLAGEVRPVQRLDQRISEAAKLGFERIFVARSPRSEIKSEAIEVVQITKLEEVLPFLFQKRASEN
jgi:DNA repair protein RadA/Sms